MSTNTILNSGLKGLKLEWNSDSERTKVPCGGCGHPTNGQSGKKPMCLPCTIQKARTA